MLARAAMARLAANPELDQVLLLEAVARAVDAHGQGALQVVVLGVAGLAERAELAAECGF